MSFCLPPSPKKDSVLSCSSVRDSTCLELELKQPTMMAASPATGIQIWRRVEETQGLWHILLETIRHETWGKLGIGGQSTEKNLLVWRELSMTVSYYRKRVNPI